MTTRYEIVLISPDGPRWRVPLWTVKKGRLDVGRAATTDDYFGRIHALAGLSDLIWDVKAQAYRNATGWLLRASGRTQLEAEREPLPLLPKTSPVVIG